MMDRPEFAVFSIMASSNFGKCDSVSEKVQDSDILKMEN